MCNPLMSNKAHSTCRSTVFHSVWCMTDGIDSPLASILAFSTDLKGIRTPHSLFRDFGAHKKFTTRWSGGRFQVWVQVRAPASGCLSSDNHSRRLYQKAIEDFDCKINGRAFGAALRHSLGRVQPAELDRQAQAQGVFIVTFRVGGSHCCQQQASKRKSCYHSCNTDSVRELMLC